MVERVALPGLRIVSRATASAGRSRTSLPEASSLVSVPVFCKQQYPVRSSASRRRNSSLFKNDQRVAFADGLPFLDRDLLHRAGVLRLDRHLHLHRLEDHDGVALVDVSPGETSIFQTVPVM